MSFARLRRSDDCPSDFLLDQLMAGELAGDAGHAVRAHARHCSACGARLVSFEEDYRSPLPQLAHAARIRTETQRAPWRRWAWPALGVAAAMLALFVMMER